MLPRFDRSAFGAGERLTQIGSGAIGGKATGLVLIRDEILPALEEAASPFQVFVPALAVLTTEVFDRFLGVNGLWEKALAGERDEILAQAFQKGTLPPEFVGDLWALVETLHTPLAVRSSSLLEDALVHPFAGVYATKMTPNNQASARDRFSRLVEAVKFVLSSTFFRAARDYRTAAGAGPRDEKMAVILQEVVGRRHAERFYPDISGVARSFAFYRSGGARPEEGAVQLALGLGKTIVDGERCWSYSPAHPRAAPPFASARSLLRETQTGFWAVNMGRPSAFDPTRETEYLVCGSLADAELDGTLHLVASTYDAASDRLRPGTFHAGPRALDFAPILVHEQLPLNRVLRATLAAAAAAAGGPVEVEFALMLPPREVPRLALLQVRPMAVAAETVELSAERPGWRRLVASDHVMGNGVFEGLADVVYLRPNSFDLSRSREAAREIASLNLELADALRPYMLLGFGRWGSADPWLGVPVAWGDVSGARAVVEGGSPTCRVEMSQGSHFFHNLAAFGVAYFSVPPDGGLVDWEWLDARPAVSESELLRHVRLATPLRLEVDGRSGRGIIWRSEGAS